MGRNDHGEPIEVEAEGRAVTISSPDKVMFPEHGETKADLARYYLAVGEPLMRTVRDRPTLLQRVKQRFPLRILGVRRLLGDRLVCFNRRWLPGNWHDSSRSWSNIARLTNLPAFENKRPQ